MLTGNIDFQKNTSSPYSISQSFRKFLNNLCQPRPNCVVPISPGDFICKQLERVFIVYRTET